MNKLRTLVFDIETAPIVAYVWDRHDQNIGINQIKSDWYVLGWAAKWLGDPPSRVIYKDQRNAKNLADDRALLLPLWKLLDEADIVITQNGQNFDSPKLNARFIMHGMNPPSPYRHIDTYRIVRRVAKFTANSLEYLTDKLCVKYKKLLHKNFPGMELWKQCLAGNKKAWAEMKRYNIHDVLATEELYTKIRAWAPESMPNIHIGDKERKCRVCGHREFMHRRGTGYSQKRAYYKYQCRPEMGGCGAWTRGEYV